MNPRVELRRSYFGSSILALLSVAGCSLVRSHKEPAPAEEIEDYASVDPGFRIVGALHYLRREAVTDDVTLVHGGADEAAVLAYRDRAMGKSHWFFLGGRNLFVASHPGAPWYASASERGRFITTTRPFDWSEPREANRRELSWLIADLFDLSRTPPPTSGTEGKLKDIRHAPFFVGKGWTGGLGATWAEVQDLCESLGLVPLVQTPTTEGYVRRQDPAGGSLMELGAGNDLLVWFDGTPTGTPPAPAGDSFLHPIRIEDPDGDDVAVVPVRVTAVHADDAKSSILKPDGTPLDRDRKDVFLDLPAEAMNRVVTVRLVEPRDRVILTAWKIVGGHPTDIPSGGRPYTSQLGVWPKLEFLHDSEDIVIMVEFDTRNTGSTVLRIEW